MVTQDFFLMVFTVNTENIIIQKRKAYKMISSISPVGNDMNYQRINVRKNNTPNNSVSFKGEKGAQGDRGRVEPQAVSEAADRITSDDFPKEYLFATGPKGDPGEPGDIGLIGDPGAQGEKGAPATTHGKKAWKGFEYWDNYYKERERKIEHLRQYWEDFFANGGTDIPQDDYIGSASGADNEPERRFEIRENGYCYINGENTGITKNFGTHNFWGVRGERGGVEVIKRDGSYIWYEDGTVEDSEATCIRKGKSGKLYRLHGCGIIVSHPVKKYECENGHTYIKYSDGTVEDTAHPITEVPTDEEIARRQEEEKIG